MWDEIKSRISYDNFVFILLKIGFGETCTDIEGWGWGWGAAVMITNELCRAVVRLLLHKHLETVLSENFR